MKLAVKLPNFSLTRGQVPVGGSERLRAMARRVRNVGSWIAVAVGFFVLFAWLSLPTRAIAWRISHEAKKAGYIVDVEDVSVSLFGDLVLENVTWTFEPSRPDQIPGKFLLNEVEIDISFFSLMIGNFDVDIEARRDEGIITAHYDRDSESSSFDLKVEDLPLYDVPKASQALNAPLLGIFALEIHLEMPENKFAKANGSIDISCTACSIGDGETKLYIPGSKGLKDGVTIPQIDLGTFVGKMVVDKGAAKTEGPMATSSEDIELSVEGSIKFKDPFPKSRLDLTVKFNVTDAMQAKSEKLRLVIQGSDPKSKLDPPEKGLGYVLTGPLSRPQFRGIKSKTARETAAERRAKQKARDEKRRKAKEAKEKDKDAKDTGEEPSSEPATSVGEAGVGGGTPVPTQPGENGLDVEPATPPGSTPPTTPPPSAPPTTPPTMPPPAEPAPTPEPTPAPAEPSPEQPPPEPPAEQPAPPPAGDTGEQPQIVPEGQAEGAPDPI